MKYAKETCSRCNDAPPYASNAKYCLLCKLELKREATERSNNRHRRGKQIKAKPIEAKWLTRYSKDF